MAGGAPGGASRGGSGEMSADEIAAVVQSILVDDLYLDLDWYTTGADADLVDDLGLGSLELTELRTLCELRFGVRIADPDFTPAHFASVATLAAFLAGQVEGAS